MSEIADRYARLADAFTDRIRSTPGDLWDAPSPCEGWTARDVVAHVINGHRGILAAVRGTPPTASHGVGVAFNRSVPAPHGADAQTAFLCFTGRRP